MSPTNHTFGWGSNSTSNAAGGGYQTNSFNNNNNNNNNKFSPGGAQQLPNFQDTWGSRGPGTPSNASTVWAGSNSIFGERIIISDCNKMSGS